jgi:hypothetical protein
MANDRDDLGHVTMMGIGAAALVAHLGGDRLTVAASQRSARELLAGEMTGCCGAEQASAPKVSGPRIRASKTVLGGLRADPSAALWDRPLHGGPEHLAGPTLDRIGRRDLGNRKRWRPPRALLI